MSDRCTAWLTKAGRVTVHTGGTNANRLLSPNEAERLADEIRKAARHARQTAAPSRTNGRGVIA